MHLFRFAQFDCMKERRSFNLQTTSHVEWKASCLLRLKDLPLQNFTKCLTTIPNGRLVEILPCDEGVHTFDVDYGSHAHSRTPHVCAFADPNLSSNVSHIETTNFPSSWYSTPCLVTNHQELRNVHGGTCPQCSVFDPSSVPPCMKEVKGKLLNFVPMY